MLATGFVRRVDPLGRIAIPEEIRKKCHVQEYEPFEFFIDDFDGIPVICLSKYDYSIRKSLIDFKKDIIKRMEGIE